MAEPKKASYLDLKDTETRNAKKQLLKSGYSSTKRMFEITWLILGLVLLPLAIRNIFKNAAVSSLGNAFAGAIVGILFADFMSGIVHWIADTWGSLEVPLIGPTFIRSFREHHLAPNAMCEHDMVETNGDNVMLTIPVLAMLAFSNMLANSKDGIYAAPNDVFRGCFWLTACVGIALTNQFHKWSHGNDLPAIVEFLQRNWIILPKENHNIHHRPPFDNYYCITTGWMNPVLSAINFWRIAEKVVTFFTGWIPREDDYKWTGLSNDVPDVVKKFLKEKQSGKSQ